MNFKKDRCCFPNFFLKISTSIYLHESLIGSFGYRHSTNLSSFALNSLHFNTADIRHPNKTNCCVNLTF